MASVGTTFGGYRLDGVLGTGGMGVVYRATDLAVGRTVALKLIPGENAADPVLRARFEREWRAAAAMDHPHVVPIYAAGQIEGCLYMAMRHVAGGDLGALLAGEGRLPLQRAIRIVEQVAAALDAAHAAGLVHRDVKPSNILLATGTADHAYLTDFGVVQLDAGAPRLTRAGALVGTVDYAAPEQLAGGEVGPAADVYALGAVLYEMVTGVPRYHGQSEAEVLRAHFEDTRGDVSGALPPALAHLEAVLGRAMARRPEDRYATAGRLAQDLRARADQGTHADGAVEVAGPPPEALAAASTRKVVTVLALTVAAATEVGGHADPEVVRPALERARAAGDAVLDRHGAEPLPAAGGMSLAVFGASASHEDDALRAVRAGLELVSELHGAAADPSGVRLRVQVGIATAEAVVTSCGGAPAVEGDAIGAALRLAAMAPPAGVLVAAGTEVLVRPVVRAESRGGPAPAFLVHDVRADADLLATTPEAPLVGRQAELGHLRHAFERVVQERRSSLVTVLGPPGIGKSRLRRELAAEVGSRAQILVGRCLPYGEDITFWPLAEIVRAAAEGRDLDALADLVDDGTEGAVVVQRLAGALGLAPAGAGEETSWAARKLFEGLARRRPTVLVFEDVHWAEPAMLDLIEHVADWARDVPLMLVCLARVELLSARPAWGGGMLNATTLALEPLTAAQSEAVIDTLADRSAVDPQARRAAVAAAEGNPLFLEHLAALLGSAAEGGDTAMPPTIQAVLAARLDALEPAERALLTRAAVVGREFWRGALDALAEDAAPEELTAALRSLQRRDLIRALPSALPGEDSYAFRHMLLREVAYASLPKAVRAEAHERFADWLEHAAPERLAEHEEILGYHAEVAHGYRRELGLVDAPSLARARQGAERLASAGRRALARDDHRAGVGLLSRALALAGDDPGRERMLVDLCGAHVDAREVAEAEALLALPLDPGPPDGWLRSRLAIERGFLDLNARPEQSVRTVEQTARAAAEALGRLGDHEGLARLALLQGDLHLLGARSDDARGALERGLAEAQRAGDLRLQERLVYALGTALYNSPARLEEVAAFARRWLDWARANDALTLQARLLQGLGTTQGRLGHFDEARALLAQAEVRQRDLGRSYDLAHARAAMGLLELQAGQPEAAVPHLMHARDELRRVGDALNHPTVAAEAALALVRLGRDDEALPLIEACRSAAATDDRPSQVTWRLALGEMRLRAGALEEAEALAREAVTCADGSDSTMMRADALIALAAATGRRGLRDEASRHALQARALADEKGYVPGAAAAARVLEMVSAESGRGAA